MKLKAKWVVVTVLMCVFTRMVYASIDLSVSNFLFGPDASSALLCPEQVSFTLANAGPEAAANLTFKFFLSRNAIYGDDDDVQIGIVPYTHGLNPSQSSNLFLTVAGRSLLTFPSNADGAYYIFVVVTADNQTDNNPGNNFAVADNKISISPLSANDYAVFSTQNISTQNMNILPKTNFVWNANYGNSWVSAVPGGFVSGSFSLQMAGDYVVSLVHLTSFVASCPAQGYSPIDFYVNEVPIITNYDVATAHEGVHTFVNDSWRVRLRAGSNNFVLRSTNECSNYWLQRLAILKAPEFVNITRDNYGRTIVYCVAEANHTNFLLSSIDLTNWSVIAQTVATTNMFSFVDAQTAGNGLKFYKLLQP